MKPAAIYARVSTADQVKGTSLDGQVALCQDYAREHGFTVIKTVQEDMSGARLDRPKLREIRDMAARREIGALLISEQDRLSRDLGHTYFLLDEFEQRGVEIIFIREPRDNSAEGQVHFGMNAVFKQWERAKIAERLRRGKLDRLNKGQVMTTRCCPFGYQYLASEKRLEELEDEAVWVRKIFDWMVLEGCSMREICQRLQERGVPTKNGARAWIPSTVRGILNNEAYIGTWHYGKYETVEPKNPRSANPNRKKLRSSKALRPRSEWLSVPVPAIVSQELFDAAQPQLEHNKMAALRNSKRPYLLRGLLFCARCGHKMYGYTQTTGTTGCYQCPGRTTKYVYLARGERCDQPNVSLARLEKAVWGEVEKQLSDENVLRQRLEERESELRRGRKDDEAELEILVNLEAGLKREADKLLDYALSDVIDKETLQERMAIVREKQAGLTRSRAEVTARLMQWEQGPDADEAINHLCEIARLGLPLLDFEEKRAFLEGVNMQLQLDGNKVTITGLITESITLYLLTKPARSQPDDRRIEVHNANITPKGDARNMSIPFYAVLSL